MENLKKKKGFTLIELIIVIAIIGILAAIAVPKFGDIQNNSRKKSDVTTAKTIADAATILIADGTLDTSTTTVATTHIMASTTDTVSTSIKGKLQNGTVAPQTKGYTDFYVIINSSGDVTVYAKKSGESDAATRTSTQQLYPVVGSDF